jgi:hypothetical protein
MSQSTSTIILYGSDGNDVKISNKDNKLSFTGVDRYDFDDDVYAKNVKLANENDIQNLQNEIDNILPLSNYAYINGNDETSQLGGIPFGTGDINTLIQSPDFLYDNINKVVKVDNINLATQTQIDTLQTEIDNIPVPNPNVWINSDGITTTNNLIPFTDGLINGMITDSAFSYQVYDNQNFLTVGSAQVISSNNNMKLESTDYILTNKDFYLQGTEDVQRYLTVGRVGLINNVKTSVNITTSDYICDNQLASKTQWKGASEYDFDNDVKIGDISTTKKLYLNGSEITPSGGGGLSAGVLRALNINQIVPTVAQTYNIVWSNLTVAEKAIWAGGSEQPIAGVNNSWGFQKLVAGTQKINWTLPFDFLTANLSFQDLQSVYAIIRLNTSSNISAEGYMWFQIQSQNIVPDPPLYRTRWNYANSASGVISQLGNTYKIYASDAIPLSTAASNTGKGQEPYPLQTKYKSNPVDVEPTSLFAIPFTKFVVSPTGDTSQGYTSANVQSIALNTASNINTYNFDVIAIGFNSVRYNLFFA